MKIPSAEEQAKFRAAFGAGAIGHDVPQGLAEQLWERLAANADFGFCKAHAASYGVVAYRMAYCKAQYPAELLAAVLDNQAGFYPAQVYVEEARRLGLTFQVPDINTSAAGTRAQGRTILLGLNAVKGLRRETVTGIVDARRAEGLLRTLADLLTRVALHLTEIRTLIEVGALARLAAGHSRPELLWQAKLWAPILERARARELRGGQARLPLAEPLPPLPPDMPPLRPYSPAEWLDLERGGLGVTVSANPLAPYADQLARYGAVPARELPGQTTAEVVVGGSPVVVRRHLTRGGEWMLFLTLQDQTDLCEVVIMPDAYPGAWPALTARGPLVARGQPEIADHGGVVVRATKLRALRPPT